MNIAMIGTGSFAQRHLTYLSTLEEVKIVGQVGTSPEKAQAAANTFGGSWYTSTAALLKAEALDAVWISVPPFAHSQIEPLLVEAGIPFFVEKPLAADLKTAEAIAEAVTRKNLLTAVGYHWRALDFLPHLKQLLNQNEVRLVVGSWFTNTPPPYWWRNQLTSGGQMVEQATHLFDLARYLLGEGEVVQAVATRKPRRSQPVVQVDDVTSALLRFSNGAIGTFSATSLLNKPDVVQLQLICEGLSIKIEGGRLHLDDGGETQVITASQNPYHLENELFLEALRHNDPAKVLCNYADALLTHRLCWEVLVTSQS